MVSSDFNKQRGSFIFICTDNEKVREPDHILSFTHEMLYEI